MDARVAVLASLRQVPAAMLARLRSEVWTWGALVSARGDGAMWEATVAVPERSSDRLLCQLGACAKSRVPRAKCAVCGAGAGERMRLGADKFHGGGRDGSGCLLFIFLQSETEPLVSLR